MRPTDLARDTEVLARNASRQVVLARRVTLALDAFSRFRGLMGRPALGPDEGLLLAPCRGIHTLFMRFSIDALFLDPRGRVVAARADLAPWRATPYVADAYCTLELRAGALAESGTLVGDEVVFEVARPEGP